MNRKQEEKLKGGLSALLGENSAPSEEKPAGGQPQQQQLIDGVQDEELRALLEEKRKEHLGRPKKDTKHLSRTEGYERMTTIVNTEKMEKLKAIALRETKTIKEVMEEVMDLAIEAYERKHGPIKVRKSKDKGIFK